MVDRARRIKWTETQVVECYRELHSTNKAAKHLKIGQTTVLRILMKAGVKPYGLEKYRADARSFDPAVDAEIARKYSAGAISADLAREHGVTIYAIKQAIRRAGGALRLNPAPTIRPGEADAMLRLYAAGHSQARVSVELNRTQSFVSRVLRKHGITASSMARERHGAWAGGRHVTQGGYWRVLVAFDDPMVSMANGGLYVLEHRLVMARHLGRTLTERETVHHINGDRADNRLENLQLRQGKHGKGCAMRCLDCGSHRIGYTPLKESK